MKIRSKQNWKLLKSDKETPKGKSLTVPDDSYTVQELLEKHAQGIMMSTKPVLWPDEDHTLDDPDLEDFNRQPIGDREEIAREIIAQRDISQQTLKEAQEKAKKLKADQDEIDRLEKADKEEFEKFRKGKKEKATSKPDLSE